MITVGAAQAGVELGRPGPGGLAVRPCVARPILGVDRVLERVEVSAPPGRSRVSLPRAVEVVGAAGHRPSPHERAGARRELARDHLVGDDGAHHDHAGELAAVAAVADRAQDRGAALRATIERERELGEAKRRAGAQHLVEVRARERAVAGAELRAPRPVGEPRRVPRTEHGGRERQLLEHGQRLLPRGGRSLAEHGPERMDQRARDLEPALRRYGRPADAEVALDHGLRPPWIAASRCICTIECADSFLAMRCRCVSTVAPRDEQLRRDLVVRVPADQQLEHLALAPGQAPERIPRRARELGLDGVPRHARREIAHPPSTSRNRVDDLGARLRLQREAARTRAQHVRDQPGLIDHRQPEDLAPRLELEELAREADPGHGRHQDVDHGDVELERLASSSALAASPASPITSRSTSRRSATANPCRNSGCRRRSRRTLWTPIPWRCSIENHILLMEALSRLRISTYGRNFSTPASSTP